MCFCSLEKQISSRPYECVYACTFHPKSVLTCAITSISNVAQTTGAIKGPLSVDTVSIHRAIMAAIQTALVNIQITNRIVLNEISFPNKRWFLRQGLDKIPKFSMLSFNVWSRTYTRQGITTIQKSTISLRLPFILLLPRKHGSYSLAYTLYIAVSREV